MECCKNSERRNYPKEQDSNYLHKDKAKVKCFCSKEILSNKICSGKIKSEHLVVDKEYANDVCAVHIKANEAELLSVNANELCAKNARIDNLCVNNLNYSSIQKRCEKYRAAVTFSNNVVYGLGSAINWDVSLDDPNGSVSFGPFKYTVPESGYYTFDFHLDTNNLQGPGVIAGSPISSQTLLRNGSEIIDSQSPFLTFNNGQATNMPGLVILNAGDIITMTYEIFIMDPNQGLIPFPGTITIEGDGTLSGKSFFTIHYLSSLVCNDPILCPPCEPIGEPCRELEVNCDNPCFEEEDGCNFRY